MAEKKVFETLAEQTRLPIEVVKSDVNATRIERLLENNRILLNDPKTNPADKDFLLDENRGLRDKYLKAQVRAIKTRREMLRDFMVSTAKLTKEESKTVSNPFKGFPITSKEFGKKLNLLRQVLLKEGPKLGLLEELLKSKGGVGAGLLSDIMADEFARQKEPPKS